MEWEQRKNVSKTLFLASSAKKKSLAKIQIHILIIPLKRNSVMNMHPKLEAILNAWTVS